MPTPNNSSPDGMIPEYKGQPWVVFDTVASVDYSVGSAVNAYGSNLPAITGQGEMIFFAAGRNRASFPQLTNMDQNGQLSYGFEVHACAIEIQFPSYTAIQSIDPAFSSAAAVGQAGTVPPTLKLAELLINWSVVELDLGQEEQLAWPLSSFGNAGGLWSSGTSPVVAQNGFPDINCMMSLPEPIEMPRTQNMSAKIRISPIVFPIIGVPTALGVGQPLAPYKLATAVTPTFSSLPQPPYAVKFKLIGERIKDAQYGAANS